MVSQPEECAIFISHITRDATTRSRDTHSRRSLRQGHREDAALSGEVPDGDGAGVPVDGLLGNGEPEPESAPVLVRLAECLENLLLVAAPQTTALVLDLDRPRACAHNALTSPMASLSSAKALSA